MRKNWPKKAKIRSFWSKYVSTFPTIVGNTDIQKAFWQFFLLFLGHFRPFFVHIQTISKGSLLQLARILNEQGSIICHKSDHNLASYRPLVLFFSYLTLGMSLTCLEAYFSFSLSAKRRPPGARYNIPPKIGRMKYISLEHIFYAFVMPAPRSPVT